MKKIILLFFAISFISLQSPAQFTKYIIRFKDKIGTPFSIDNPIQFLSQKSIDRRTRQYISIDETDLPITPRYIDSVRLSGNVAILNNSKWLNQVCIATTDSTALAKINSFPFVITAQPLMKPVGIQSGGNNKFNETFSSPGTPVAVSNMQDYYAYGNSFAQINIHNGEYLHDKGLHGEGMSIAILDAGYYHYLSIPAFDSVLSNNQVKDTYDFVLNQTDVNEDYYHGMSCFSIMAANLPGVMVGSSPKANYYLYVSEDVTSESPVEEQNWAAAAERADSFGVDVISTSLGYSLFDNPIFNNSYADMNGHTTIAALAAGLAAKKGMIVVIAAGNAGNTAWHYITTPADADSIIAVGAVNTSGVVASFSSYGPSSDGRVKPEVGSVGEGAALIYTDGSVLFGNGTSFATPNIAGLTTCLWQAFPDFTNMDIIKAIEKSSNIFNTPDNRIGYGIPNFKIAYDDLYQQRTLRNINTILGTNWIKIYPNPFSNNFNVAIKPQHTSSGNFRFYDAAGKYYFSKQVSLQEGQPQIISFDNLQPFQKGIYFLKFSDEFGKQSFKLVVQ
jgi:serine protease AprX